MVLFADPFTAYGFLSTPLFVSNALTLLGFFLAAYLAIKYTQNFYERREKPRSWVMIVFGLIFIVVAELMQFLLPYRIDPTLWENIFVLIAQNAGIILIAGGAYSLSKEV